MTPRPRGIWRRSLHAFCVLACALCAGLPARAAEDTRTLWPRAVALMQSGRPAEAVPLLDRLVSAHPDNREYRLELGYALYRTGRHARARYHLDRARAGNRDPAQLAAADRLIAASDASRVLSGQIGFAIRPETNPGRQTTLGSVDVFGFPVTLDDTARAREATTYILTTGVTARPRIARNARLTFGIETWSRFAEPSALRDHILSLRIGPQITLASGALLEFGALGSRRWASGKLRSDTAGGYAALGVPWGSKAYLLLRGQREHQTNYNATVPEDRTRLSAQLNYLATPSLLLRGAIDGTVTRASIPGAAGTRLELRLGASKSFGNGIDLRADLWGRTDRRDGPDQVFGIVRDDTVFGLELGVSDRDIRVGPFVPELIVGAEQGRSSIRFYDYDNAYVNLGLRARF